MGLWLGYDSAFELEFPGAAFPVGAAFRAQVRTHAGSATLLGELTTAGGTIERMGADVLRIKVPGVMSGAWNTPLVLMDLVRTDIAPPLHLNVQIEATFEVPVTKPAA